MKFKNSKGININGTSFKSYFNASYDELVKVFGEPTYFGGDKSTCGWDLEFEDGTIATIYDWKTQYTPLNEYNWHIGGFNNNAVKLITEAFNNKINN